MKRTILSLIILFFLSQNLFANTVKVIDGDTIKIGNEKIRFGGIDAPELKQICFKNEEKISCGILVKNILKKKIGKETPKCISEGKDVYKRTIAECFINGESLSKFLVGNGYAFAYRKYSRKFIKDERFAKKNKLGLWSMNFIFPWEFRKL
tara:strand:- start:6820 stop:7272 length:453 start_codon:yes stop_codon:yes gene_type:complete